MSTDRWPNMSHPPSSPVEALSEFDPVPEPSSGEVESSTLSNSSAGEAGKKSDPLDIGPCEGDGDRTARHKAAPVAEEGIHERVTIPEKFAAEHLWPLSDLSSSTLSANLAGHITLPPIVVSQARLALSHALSPLSQLSNVPLRSTPEPTMLGGSDESSSVSNLDPFPEPVVTLFCPFDHTAGVIDTLVRSIAQSERADVLVLDALMFTHNNDLGPS